MEQCRVGVSARCPPYQMRGKLFGALSADSPSIQPLLLPLAKAGTEPPQSEAGCDESGELLLRPEEGETGRGLPVH